MKVDSSTQCLLFKNIIVVEITCFIHGTSTGVNTYWALAFDDCVLVSFTKLCSTWSLIKLLENQQYLIAHGNSQKRVIIVILALSLVIHVVCLSPYKKRSKVYFSILHVYFFLLVKRSKRVIIIRCTQS
ncbi:hypothetical protein AMTRI_Chr05g61120 [Amborella trichopoda]